MFLSIKETVAILLLSTLIALLLRYNNQQSLKQPKINNLQQNKDMSEIPPAPTPANTQESDDALTQEYEETQSQNDISNNNKRQESTTITTEQPLKKKKKTTLEDFGYIYNEHGQLRSKEDGSKFKFVDQRHYEDLGDVIAEHIQQMMKSNHDLQEVLIPTDADPQKEACSNIFLSKDFYTNQQRLMVIICGSGQVKAGQWARSLCINDSLDTGAIFNYLKLAEQGGYALLILNPNQYTGFKEYKNKHVRGSENPSAHVYYCYENFIKQSPAKTIAVVAHSYGGQLTMDLISKYKLFDKRLGAIGFTDSVHRPHKFTQTINDFLDESCCNWVASNESLDTPYGVRHHCIIVSSGSNAHERTSASCINSLFKFVNERVEKKELENNSSK